MRKVKTKNKYLIQFAAVAVLIIIAAAIRIFSVKALGFQLLRSGIYIFIILMWGISIRRRIIQVQSLRYLTCVAALMVFWLAVRSVKYHFAETPFWNHQLWYWYYLALLNIPLFAMFVSFSLNKPDNYRLPKKILLLCIPAVMIFLMVITNDLHQFVFAFPNGEIVYDGDYTYGFGVCFVVGWQIVCGTIAVVTMIIRCRIARSKNLLRLPLVPLVAAMLYTLLYAIGVKPIKVLCGDMTVSLCLLITAVFECCIQCGLIQSNIGYASLYAATTIGSQITDADFNVVHSSSTAVKISEDNMKRAVSNDVFLDENTLLKGHPIRGGYVFWQEDITELAAVSRELEVIRDELRDTGDIIRTESEQKEYWLRILEENRLYDLIEEQTAPQVAFLQSALSKLKETDDLDEAKKLLGKIVVVGTYVKRKSNMILIYGQNDVVDAGELYLCIDETAKNLVMYGIDCKVNFDVCGVLLPVVADEIYDFIEMVLEHILDSGKYMFIYVGKSNGCFQVNISVRCDGDFSRLCEQIPMLSAERDDDGIWYLSLTFEKGGEIV